MKSVDTGYVAPGPGNPFKVGPYIVYAATYPAENGQFGAIVFAERMAVDGEPAKPALNMHRISQNFPTLEKAAWFAIEFGVSKLKSREALN